MLKQKLEKRLEKIEGDLEKLERTSRAALLISIILVSVLIGVGLKIIF